MNNSPFQISDKVAPVQAERREPILLSDGRLVMSKSKHTHEEMDLNEITDLSPEGSIYFSHNEKFPERVLEMVHKIDVPLYREGKPDNTKYKEYTIGDLLKKSEEPTMANVVTRLAEEYPFIEGIDDDELTFMANQDNIATRTPFMAQLAIIGKIMQLTAEDNSNQELIQYMKHGGSVKKIPHAGGFIDFLTGGGAGVIGSATQLLESIVTGIIASKNKKRNQKTIDEAAATQKENLAQGTGVQAMFTAAQNPEVVAPDYTEARRAIKEAPTASDQYIIDSMVSQQRGAGNNIMNQAFRNSGSTSEALAKASPVLASIEQNVQGILTNQLLRQQEYKFRKSMSLADLEGRAAAQEADATNRTTGNQNQILGSFGSLGANYYSGLNAIESDRVNATLANSAQAAVQTQSALNTGADAIAKGAAYYSFYNTDFSKAPGNYSSVNVPANYAPGANPWVGQGQYIPG